MSRTKTITLTIGSLAAGAVLATGITGVAMAADSSPTPRASTAVTSPASGVAMAMTAPGDRQGDHGPGARGMVGAPGSQPLHGEAVVKAADGTISTVLMIHGSVTAVSGTSITVKAEDGFSATFVVDSATKVRTGLPDRSGPDRSGSADGDAPAAGTIADVTVGDVAHVRGTGSGSTATATDIHAMTAAEAAQLAADRLAHEQGRAGAASTASPTLAG